MLRTKSNNMNLPLSLFDHEIRRMDLDYGRATELFDVAVEVSEERMTRAQDVEMRVHNTLCLLVHSVGVKELEWMNRIYLVLRRTELAHNLLRTSRKQNTEM
jgi:hypothetical protein